MHNFHLLAAAAVGISIFIVARKHSQHIYYVLQSVHVFSNFLRKRPDNPDADIGSAAEVLSAKLCSISHKTLGVLGPVKRERTCTLAKTRCGAMGQQLDEHIAACMRGSVFIGHDPRFSKLVGTKPELLRLAKKDYSFAHEVLILLP